MIDRSTISLEETILNFGIHAVMTLDDLITKLNVDSMIEQ